MKKCKEDNRIPLSKFDWMDFTTINERKLVYQISIAPFFCAFHGYGVWASSPSLNFKLQISGPANCASYFKKVSTESLAGKINIKTTSGYVEIGLISRVYSSCNHFGLFRNPAEFKFFSRARKFHLHASR